MDFRDSFVHNFRLFSSNVQFHLLVKYLKGILAQRACDHTPEDLIELWQYCKQQESTLPMLAVLSLRIIHHMSTFTTDELIAWCSYFLNNFKPAMVSFMPDAYFNLWHRVAEVLIERKETSRGINCLRMAILRFVPSLEILTPIHSDLFMLCLYSTNLKPALPFLEAQISAVFGENAEESKALTKNDETKVLRMEHNAAPFDVKYYLLYCYYGGSIFAALKRMREALYMFELAITISAEAANDIVVAAYKKWVLTSLLVNGQLGSLPAYSRFSSCLSGWYYNLADAYTRADFVELDRTCSSKQEMFKQDKNDGLVNQVKKRCPKKHILALGNIYAVMSLTALVEHCQLRSLEGAEQLLFDMAAHDEIRVKIDQKNGTVSFFQEPVKKSVVESVKTQLKRLEMTLSIVQNLDKNLTSSIEESRKKCAREEAPVIPDDEGMCDSVSGMRDFGDD